jgi:hypothetical protein
LGPVTFPVKSNGLKYNFRGDKLVVHHDPVVAAVGAVVAPDRPSSPRRVAKRVTAARATPLA